LATPTHGITTDIDINRTADALTKCIRRVAKIGNLKAIYIPSQLVDDESVGLARGAFAGLRACLMSDLKDIGVSQYTPGTASPPPPVYMFYVQSGSLQDAFKKCPEEWWKRTAVGSKAASSSSALNLLSVIPYEPTTTYPPYGDIFAIFKRMTPQNIRVIILGQDPYINEGEATGIAFSVRKGVPVPPSLRNIFTELRNEGYTVTDPSSGDLSKWVDQGVFLYNTALTVAHRASGSHTTRWAEFSAAILSHIDMVSDGYVALLWGQHAKRYEQYLTRGSNASRILTSSHPSPLSAARGFLGCGHFRTANEILRRMGKEEIDWNL
jgi:uracil-DNA glycosylase